jgi:Zn-dependent M28 family amino/carboxypeptidase
MPHRSALVVSVPLLALLGASAASLGAPPHASHDVSASHVRAHVEFLADDLLEGREAGTRGHEIAARYAAAALASAGWSPAADDGTYFQRVPFVEGTRRSSSMRLSIAGKSSEVPLPAEGIVLPNATREQVDVSAPVVFAGFGVTAPEHGYDDYAGLDVKGKIVAVRANAPASLPSEPRAHYASADHKLKTAADHGAVAVVTLLGPDDERRYPWAQMTMYLDRPLLAWAGSDGTPGAVEKRLQATAYLNQQGAARLFAGSPLTFDAAVEAGRKGTPGGAALAATLTISVATTHGRVTSPNVVAVLRGTDPALAATSVVLTAHLDHIGVKPSGSGDRINNGAYDNATGSAILLEIARALGSAPARPKRSVIVALVTAEEKGLLGSDYLAHVPVEAAGRIVANVNIDMPVFIARSKDVIAFGSENSTLDAVVRRAAADAGLALSPDPLPEQNLFVRSDQYSFVKKGVPAVYLTPGFTARDPGVKGEDLFMGFIKSHYHQPSDDVSLPMDLAAVEQFTRLTLDVVRAIADDPTAPSWKPGNFFGKTFAGTK